jgi:hypothetical protein
MLFVLESDIATAMPKPSRSHRCRRVTRHARTQRPCGACSSRAPRREINTRALRGVPSEAFRPAGPFRAVHAPRPADARNPRCRLCYRGRGVHRFALDPPSSTCHINRGQDSTGGKRSGRRRSGPSRRKTGQAGPKQQGEAGWGTGGKGVTGRASMRVGRVGEVGWPSGERRGGSQGGDRRLLVPTFARQSTPASPCCAGATAAAPQREARRPSRRPRRRRRSAPRGSRSCRERHSARCSYGSRARAHGRMVQPLRPRPTRGSSAWTTNDPGSRRSPGVVGIHGG